MFKTNITISQWSNQNSPSVTPQTQPAAPQPQLFAPQPQPVAPQPQLVAPQPQPLIVQAQPSHVLVSVPQAYPSTSQIQLAVPQVQPQVQPQLYQTQPTLYQTQPSLYQNQPLLPQTQLPVPQIQAQPSVPSAPPSPQPQLCVPQPQASLIQTQLSVSQTQASLPQAQTPVPQTQPLVTQPSVPQVQTSVAQPSALPIQSSAPQPSAPHIQPSVPEAQSSNDSDDSDGFPTLFQRKVNTPTGKKFGDIKSQSSWAKQWNAKGSAGAQATKKLQAPEKQDKEILTLEKEFKTLQIPVYDLRWTPISTSTKSDNKFKGFKNPMFENPSNASFKSPFTSFNVEPSFVSATTPKAGIPESWLAALRENTNISELINDGDAEALKHLKDVRVTYPDDEALDFQLHFYFDANDFFTDKELTKAYYFSNDGSSSENGFVSVRAEGCEIHWKKNKDLTKSTTDTSTVYKFDSFFDLFSSPTMPSDEDIENRNVDEGDLENLQDCLQLHCQIGEELKENIIPLVADYLSEKAPKYEAEDPNPLQKKGGDGDKNGNNKYEKDDDPGNGVKDPSKRNIFSINLPSQNSKFPSLSNKGEKDCKPAATGNTKRNVFSGFK